MQAASFCLGPLVGLKPQSGILGFPALEFLPPKSLALDGRDGLLLGIFFYVILNSEKQIIDIFSNVHLWSMFGFKWRTPTQQNMFFPLTS